MSGRERASEVPVETISALCRERARCDEALPDGLAPANQHTIDGERLREPGPIRLDGAERAVDRYIGERRTSERGLDLLHLPSRTFDKIADNIKSALSNPEEAIFRVEDS